MIVWGKLIDCLIDADVNYLNGELFNSQFRVKGKFLVFGNLYTLEKTTTGGRDNTGMCADRRHVHGVLPGHGSNNEFLLQGQRPVCQRLTDRPRYNKGLHHDEYVLQEVRREHT